MIQRLLRSAVNRLLGNMEIMVVDSSVDATSRLHPGVHVYRTNTADYNYVTSRSNISEQIHRNFPSDYFDSLFTGRGSNE